MVSVNVDRKGIVRDAPLRTFPSYPVASVKPVQKDKTEILNQNPHYNSSQRRQTCYYPCYYPFKSRTIFYLQVNHKLKPRTIKSQ